MIEINIKPTRLTENNVTNLFVGGESDFILKQLKEKLKAAQPAVEQQNQKKI